MNITLHIERMVLDGLNLKPGEREQVKAAVETELARLLTGGGLTAGLQLGGAMPSIRTDQMQIDVDANPSSLGQEIARAVYGGIGV